MLILNRHLNLFVVYTISLTSKHVVHSFLRKFSKQNREMSVKGLLDIFNQGKSNLPLESWSADSLSDNAPSWDELDGILRSSEPNQERSIFDSIEKGRGPATSKATIRLFDAPDGYKPEVTLYRDSAAWCPYCEKIWLTLEEKRIPYIVEKSTPLRCYGQKPKEFLRIQPNGMLPVANIKGRVISESNTIMQALEDEFPSYKTMLPVSGASSPSRVSTLLKLERSVFSVWFSWLTSPRDMSRAMEDVLTTVNTELGVAGGPYFLGEDISLVDIMFTPFLERMAASLPYYKGYTVRDNRFPNLKKWYEAMDTRETYKGVKSDYYTHCQDLPPQIGYCYDTPAAEPFKTEISGGVWHLSVSAENCLEPMLPVDEQEARRDAVRNLLSNAPAVVRFAARGTGGGSGRGVSAPLADPEAPVPSDYLPAVDAALRHVCQAMLTSPDKVVSEGLSSGLPPVAVKSSLIYLRDRVGVPRDMSVHGARQLRAHLNWMINTV